MDGQMGAEAVNQRERRGSKRVHKHKAMLKSECHSLTTRINEYKKACFGLVYCGGFRCFVVFVFCFLLLLLCFFGGGDVGGGLQLQCRVRFKAHQRGYP